MSNKHFWCFVCFPSTWGCLSEDLAPHGFLSVALERRCTSCSMQFMLNGQNTISTSLGRNDAAFLSLRHCPSRWINPAEHRVAVFKRERRWNKKRFDFSGCDVQLPKPRPLQSHDCLGRCTEGRSFFSFFPPALLIIVKAGEKCVMVVVCGFPDL